MKITAIIPTFNEEAQIRAVIESVRWADEIMIVDSFSTDHTLDWAREYPVRIIQREYGNSASQKNWAIPQAAHEWIILVDADECVTPALRDEIIKVTSGMPDSDAYWIYRENYFLGRRIRFSGWQRDRVIRLFRKAACRYESKIVHAEIICQGNVGVLKHKLTHHTYRNAAHYAARTRRYAQWSARDRLAITPRVTWFHTLVRPAWRFLTQYVVRGGFLDGKPGWIIACEGARYLRLRYKFMKHGL